jgi:Skp family chaperone for outer membrane proteins
MKPSLAIAAMLTCLAFTPGFAQHHANLAPAEVDQLRDSMMEPDTRLKLFVKFARARLAALDQVRADPKISAADRPAETHDKLQDFVDLYDELNDNIDMYVDRKDDIRKPLKTIIEADTEFQSKLKAFQDSLAASKEDTKPFAFVLENAVDTLDVSADDHRKLLQEQEVVAKNKKKHKGEKQ